MKANVHTLLGRMAWIALLGSLLMVSSCKHRGGTAAGGSSVAGGAHSAGLAAKAVDIINANRQTETTLTAKASIKLQAGEKSAGVSGTLRMKRDDVIQLSLAFLGLMEVGRLEITPDYFLLIDRMNHQYVRVAYSQVPFFQQSGIDFHTFQSLFWGELFLPGDAGKAPQSQSYEQEIAGDTLSLTSEVRRQAALHFVASLSRALLLQTSVVGSGQPCRPAHVVGLLQLQVFLRQAVPHRHAHEVVGGYAQGTGDAQSEQPQEQFRLADPHRSQYQEIQAGVYREHHQEARQLVDVTLA